MAISLNNITKGRIERPQRIILLGVEGVGKSTFAAGAPNPIFLPMASEKGIDELSVDKFPSCQSYEDVIDSIGVIYREEHDYKTIVIDSMSALEPLIWAHLCKKEGVESVESIGGGYNRGYTKALNYWRDILEGLDALREDRGIGCILIGHVTTKEFSDPESDPYTTYTFDVHKYAAAALQRWADSILFANFKRASVATIDAGFNKKIRRGIDTGKGQRFLYTEKRPAHPGKVRTQPGIMVPYELPLDFATFEAARKGEPLKQTA